MTSILVIWGGGGGSSPHRVAFKIEFSPNLNEFDVHQHNKGLTDSPPSRPEEVGPVLQLGNVVMTFEY